MGDRVRLYNNKSIFKFSSKKTMGDVLGQLGYGNEIKEQNTSLPKINTAFAGPGKIKQISDNVRRPAKADFVYGPSISLQYINAEPQK